MIRSLTFWRLCGKQRFSYEEPGRSTKKKNFCKNAHEQISTAGQGRAGQGRAGQGRAGQGRAGQGRAGQGRAGQGRARKPVSGRCA